MLKINYSNIYRKNQNANLTQFHFRVQMAACLLSPWNKRSSNLLFHLESRDEHHKTRCEPQKRFFGESQTNADILQTRGTTTLEGWYRGQKHRHQSRKSRARFPGWSHRRLWLTARHLYDVSVLPGANRGDRSQHSLHALVQRREYNDDLIFSGKTSIRLF